MKRNQSDRTVTAAGVHLGAAVRPSMVIAGQGTLALELLQQDAHSTAYLCQSAAAVWLLAWRCCQTTDAANQSDRRRSGRLRLLKAALDAGHPVDLPRVGLFAKA